MHSEARIQAQPAAVGHDGAEQLEGTFAVVALSNVLLERVVHAGLVVHHYFRQLRGIFRKLKGASNQRAQRPSSRPCGAETSHGGDRRTTAWSVDDDQRLITSSDTTNRSRVPVFGLLIDSERRGPDECVAHEWCKAATHEPPYAFRSVDVFDTCDHVSMPFHLHAGFDGVQRKAKGDCDGAAGAGSNEGTMFLERMPLYHLWSLQARRRVRAQSVCSRFRCGHLLICGSFSLGGHAKKVTVCRSRKLRGGSSRPAVAALYRSTDTPSGWPRLLSITYETSSTGSVLRKDCREGGRSNRFLTVDGQQRSCPLAGILVRLEYDQRRAAEGGCA